jgi:septal ring factor EnvC (AmiA/AmiB activator)
MRARTPSLILVFAASVAGAAADPLADTGAVPRRLEALWPQDARNPPIASVPSELERSRAELEREQQNLHQLLAKLEQGSHQARRRMVVRGRAYVRLARANLLPAAGGVQALLDHAARLERLRASLVHDLSLTRELAARSEALHTRQGELGERLAALELKERAVAQAHTALLAAQDRELAFRRAFTSNASAPYAAVYGAGVGPQDPSEHSLGFAGMKGRLAFPVTGRTEVRPARRADGPGLELVAPLGTPVRSVHPGRVAFADRYPAYGNTVILDHGDGYFTVSANLEVLAVAAGQEVELGARLGTVGTTPHGPALYFELRRHAQVLEPSEWFGI